MDGGEEVPPVVDRQLRPVRALNLAGVEPGTAESRRPRFEWVQPHELNIDDSYQRHLSERSIALIRKIVTQWDWRRFKPPIVAYDGATYVVVDGQHTAIAAASHPEISEIPVMIVSADRPADQAQAFVGHNRDRLGITAMQLHYAAVAAGDEDAQTVAQVCERAGVRILRTPPSGGVYKAADTVAVAAIGGLVNRRGAMRARIVLQVLADARCAPVSASQIKAVEMLLHEGEYKGQVEPSDLTSALVALGVQEAEREAKVFAAAHNVPVWRGLGIIIFRRARRGRRRAD